MLVTLFLLCCSQISCSYRYLCGLYRSYLQRQRRHALNYYINFPRPSREEQLKKQRLIFLTITELTLFFVRWVETASLLYQIFHKYYLFICQFVGEKIYSTWKVKAEAVAVDMFFVLFF